MSLPFAFCWTRAGLLALAVGFALAAGLGGGLAYAQAPGGNYDEEEAQVIDQMLMCPVCPAESIDQAQVPLARQMRQRVRELLAEGASRQEVLDYFADRYGQNVLASPPKSGFNLLAWILPIAGLVAALGAALLVLRAMQGRNGGPVDQETATLEPGDSLEPYLAAVDRSLDLERARGADDEVEANGNTESPGSDEAR
ncbi:MAG: cytochrome c-type biogenesis protein CcmH [Chloroflexota bacterium]|nr:cytochrome c-type biogenesis protein CcmH [Chloroflexota bacterium]